MVRIPASRRGCRILTRRLDPGDRDIIVVIRVARVLKWRLEVIGPDSGGKVAIFVHLAFKELRFGWKYSSQMRESFCQD